jgi:lipopolysaccharide transport system ATP-binding protein
MSSSEIAVRVSNLSKKYHIYDQPLDRLKQFTLPWLRNVFKKSAKQYFRNFTALDNVSFEIKKGETIGIIGTNGSGKSTLLQLICGTLTPSDGSVEITGRVAALLELGSGFNPEFTGRENVYLNATLLGLTTDQIVERIEAIIDFSGVGEFIDQPVKVYSSGMYVRLAFSIIAHVDADILVIDEALAVGDAIFTQKCMRYIREFQKKGTLIFVSHDTASVQNLCEKSLWLSNGKMLDFDVSKKVVESYLKYTLQQVYGEAAMLNNTQSNDETSERDTEDKEAIINYAANITVQDNFANADGWATGLAEVRNISIMSLSSENGIVLEGGERVKLSIEINTKKTMHSPIVGFLVKDRLGQVLFGENTLAFTNVSVINLTEGQSFMANFIFKFPMLPNGQYVVSASIAEGDLNQNIQHHFLHDALVLNVSSSKIRWGLVGIQFESVSMEVMDE